MSSLQTVVHAATRRVLNLVPNGKKLPVVMIVLTAAAAVVLALAGYLSWISGPVLNALLYAGARCLPVAGCLLVLVAATRYSLAQSAAGWSISPPPEAGTSTGDLSVRIKTQRRVEAAVADHYSCNHSNSVRTIRMQLRDSAVRQTVAIRGTDTPTARSIVEAGDWTDDRVAAAFLSDAVSYPLAERLRAATDPGRAYRQRVRRTLDAIDRVGDGHAGRSAVDITASDQATAQPNKKSVPDVAKPARGGTPRDRLSVSSEDQSEAAVPPTQGGETTTAATQMMEDTK